MASIASILGDVDSPFDSPQTWDQIIIGGQSWSGKFEIRNAARAYKWQVKFSPGTEGAQETYRGKNPTKFEIEFFIWTTDQWNQWLTFSQNFLYQGVKGQVKPVQIQHPSLSTIGITQVVCEELGAVIKQSDDLMFSAVVKLREFFPALPVNATQSPASAKITPTTIPGVVVNSAIENALDQLALQKNQAIANGFPGSLPK